ncbi:NAD(P)-dependent dehydrogenase (short-subunit alcohol dehydrogenase family) [Roseiarcus fermentans]|uniref:NAD(P)-dependent dehydrogenase (Short-subunit alcohol dehydrogenase family) n=1 Tax=Roseiarcus fermentans TaxID=1473586 RepID=A0A366FT47_9HYPH|nr:SDR family oxidoreductase [Roseiarcus fermentans]RBP17316.1 NAD(P)-dependent dehydrogenase (short-subunit alcohol dehydrogenase family) [Roseiarcus fermentans]
MKGKTVVATGATSGVGEKAVLALARMGARIVLVARDQARAQATLGQLERVAPGLGHAAHLADLSSMADTRRVGGLIAGSEPRIDVLVNNAGAMFADRRVTPEGLERTFALNHMAYFLMTRALGGTLRASAPARVVSTASDAHAWASLDFADLQGAKAYSGWRAYGRSKLANILFTREAARRFAGSGVTVNCFHPGFVASRFGSETGGWVSRLVPLARAFALTPDQGADTLVYLASSPEVADVTGGYFVKRKRAEPSAAARDDAAAKRLWLASEALAGP